MVTQVEIGSYRVGLGNPCFIIAEAGVNHNGDMDRALQMVDLAARVGASAIKFQTFNTERLVTHESPKAAYQVQNAGATESQFDMLRRLELSAEDHAGLVERCQEQGIMFLSTPFDEGSADLLDQLGVPAFKIGSGELTNLPLLGHVARKGKPMIVSTGMANLGEVEAAVDTIVQNGGHQYALLHCVSNYPANPADVNLRAMATMANAFGVPIGYSDHTPGLEVALAAVALGACVIEKHFTLDRRLPGPDHQASIEPGELEALVQGIRVVEASLGSGIKKPAASETDTANVARRSLVAAKPIPAGATLTSGHLTLKRPGTGLPASLISMVVGRKARQNIAPDQLISLEMLE